MSQRRDDLDSPTTEKQEIAHIDHLNLHQDAVDVTVSGQGLMKSRFDELSLPKTLWTFKKVLLIVLSVYTGYMCEGFEVSCNIIVPGHLDEQQCDFI